MYLASWPAGALNETVGSSWVWSIAYVSPGWMFPNLGYVAWTETDGLKLLGMTVEPRRPASERLQVGRDRSQCRKWGISSREP